MKRSHCIFSDDHGRLSQQFSPAWTTAELLDLLSILWGEEAVQSQLRLSRRNWDTYRQISQGSCEKDYSWDTPQCRAKIKELRQAYHANGCFGAATKTCRFYKELDVILRGDPTSTTKNAVDTSAALEAAERRPNPEDEVTDEEVELDNDAELPAGSPRFGRQPGTVHDSGGCLPVSAVALW
ncbi:hypothetical protein UY3_04871 [Chelonia mydas]|uniref:Myb/SANT-like DNA-binding domain-containing protein n=1 Tax=Chelonia mydas TaxID=8469 RepID=M7BJ60_CHEMY|nr:hypothetical protein UY3_04871 [Chelonia mydas]